MNNNVMFSSKTDVWATPQRFFDELNREFNFGESKNSAPFPSMVVIFGEKGGRLL